MHDQGDFYVDGNFFLHTEHQHAVIFHSFMRSFLMHCYA